MSTVRCSWKANEMKTLPTSLTRHLRKCSMQTIHLHEFVTFMVSLAMILYLWVQ